MAVTLPVLHQRPKTRGGCALPNGLRPCPWVSCRHHLLHLDVLQDGSLKVDHQQLDIDASPAAAERFIEAVAEHVSHMRHTCSLDVADRGDATMEAVGKVIGVTRERVRQIEAKGLIAVKRTAGRRELKPDRPGPSGKSLPEPGRQRW
jgi:hypothetical protein